MSIWLYHKIKRNHRQAIGKTAYMVDAEGFMELPGTEEAEKHAMLLMKVSGFVIPAEDNPPPGFRPEDREPDPVEEPELAVEETPLVSVEDAPVEPPEPVEDAPAETEASLDQGREELRDMAAFAGLKGYKTMSKVELVEAINAAKAG